MLLSLSPSRLFLLLLLLVTAGTAAPAFALSFNAYWDYRQVGGDNIDTQEQFLQRYSLGVGPSLTYQPTHAISAAATVGYTQTQRDDGNGWRTVDQLTPAGQVSLRNDIFLAQLSGSANRYTSGAGYLNKDQTWNATLASRWVIPFWPSLRFNYSEYSESVSSTTTENGSTFVDWNLRLAQLNYQYSRIQLIDQNGITVTESDTHFGRLESSGKMWQGRLRVDFAQQLRTTTTEFFATEDQTTGQPLTIELEGQKLSAVTDPITGPEPEDVVLESNPQLGDDVLDTPALIVNDGERAHFGINFFDSEQQIDLLRITLDPLTDDQAAATLQWSLYLRDLSGTAWVLEADQVPATYDADENRFELNIGRIESEIMVVAVNQSGLSLTFTELKAFSQVTESFNKTRSTSYLTKLGVRTRLTRTLNASAYLSREHFETGLGITDNETDNVSMSGRLSWATTRYLSETLSYSENRRERTGRAEQINRVYALTVYTLPLETMNVNFGVSRTQRYSGEQKTGSTIGYNLNANAQIYPDLNASLTLNYSDNIKLDSEGLFYIGSTSFNGRLNLDARLYRTLSADITTNYRRNETDIGRSTEDADGTFSLRYRPSDLLAVRGSYFRTFLGDLQGTDKWEVSLSLGLIRTTKTRLNMTATHAETETRRSDRVGVEGSWDINKNLSLQTRANYVIGKEDTEPSRDSYNLRAYMTLRL